MDYNDYTTKKQIPWKPVAIVTGGVVMAIIILIVVLRVIRGVSDEQILLKQTSQLHDSVAELCANAKEKESCLATETKQFALTTGNAALCKDLTGGEYDGCIWELADQQSDPVLCSSLQNEDNRSMCLETVWSTIASTSGNAKDCDNIESLAIRSICREQRLGPVTSENCLSRGRGAKECELIAVADLANQKQDVRVCDTLLDERVLSCKDLVTTDDPDFDGLSSIQETGTYKTNPDKADTDSDGFNDGDEIKTGHNPNGK